jgi:acyl transferase domain-containing protein/thioesterase domain-containing protein
MSAHDPSGYPESAIAIVGMAGRFPGAEGVPQFWENLRSGVESIRPLSDEELEAAGVEPALLRDRDYVKAGGVLEGLRLFDASFFGFSPKDAAIMDPQHRHFLEVVHAAFELAGHAPSSFPGAIGVFAGCGMNAYFVRNVLTNPELLRSVGFFLLRHTGNDRDFMPSMVSYKLDLRGPSMAIQTACSTSLVAVHVACQSLLSGECDMALAGGVTIQVPHGQGYLYHENEPVSPDGHCRPFDARSAGTVVTSGAGVVVLRRLSDAVRDGDAIHALIRGSAVNNDGSTKVGYLAPSVEGHAQVVAEALAVAGVSADTISYLEAHGTGTRVGDPIELAALTQAFRETTDRKQFCRIGSVKSNIGHLDTAAGVASLIKVVESLKHRQIPPSLHFESPNPEIDFSSSPFVVNDRLHAWDVAEGRPRRAGISSLGIGGTNAHVVVEEAPEAGASDPPERSWQLLPLSCRSGTALEAATRNLVREVRDRPELPLADVAFTLQQGREPYEQRRVVACRSLEEAADLLESADPKRVFTARSAESPPSVVFMFAGAGGQHPQMGRELYESEPVYREALDRCFGLLARELDYDLKAVLFPHPDAEEAAARELEEPTRLCPAIFATEYALAHLWRSWGIEPAALIGHSLGEYAAACLAGVMSLEDALALVMLRARLLKHVSEGRMLVVPLPESEVRERMGSDLDLAAVNAPSLCVASGTTEHLEALHSALAAEEVEARFLRVASAGHCRLLDPILEEFRRGLSSIRLHLPRIPYIANVSGTWAGPEVRDPEYWVRHFRQTVRFSDGLAQLLRDGNRALLELGPGQTLASLARQQPTRTRAILSSLPRPDAATSALEHSLTTLGRLWIAGLPVEWSRLRGEERRRRVTLPTYPFERQPYWIEPGRSLALPADGDAPLQKQASLEDWFYRPIWRRSAIAASSLEDTAAAKSRWLIFLDSAGLGAAFAEQLEASGHEIVTVREGDTFYCFGDREYALAPEAGRSGYDELLGALADRQLLPERIAHFWLITADETVRPGSSFLHRNQERGFYSLLFLAQALAGAETLPSRIGVVSNGMQSVEGEDLPYPEKATLLGPVQVIPRELPGVHCQSIDIALGRASRRGHSRFPLPDLARTLVRELTAEPAAAVVAYRGQERWERDWERERPAAADAAAPLRRHGVYLVTGGLGGIGLTVAEHLARRVQARLVLVGRSALPPADAWDAWLDAHAEGDPTSDRIRSMRRLEELGAEVQVVAADVADIEAMRQLLADARDRFGSVHGVFHAAGTLEDGVIQSKTPEAAERVFTAKLHGTLVLDRLLRDDPLDFLVLFSSTSTCLGPAGQVDYTAANCFLDAFAQSRARRDRGATIALAWGVWNEAGRAIELSRRLRGEEEEPRLRRRVAHPLLGECLDDGPERWRFEARYDAAQLWILDEHRTREQGALVPGTGYLEIARAALHEAQGAEQLEMRDFAFVSPLAVRDDEPRSVRIELTHERDGYRFEVSSRPAGATRGWELHARGLVAPLAEPRPGRVDLEAVGSRCRDQRQERAGKALATSQEGRLALGPRWRSLRSLGLGEGEALARLALPPAFDPDLDHYALHPALLDVATGYALELIQGYGSEASLYVPLGYERIRVHAPLVGRLWSHVRSRGSNAIDREVATFEVVIADEQGEVLVEVEGYSMRKLSDAGRLGAGASGSHAAGSAGEAAPLSATERLFLETFEAGIGVEEGMQALERVLAGAPDRVVVSSVDLSVLLERNERVSSAQLDAPTVRFSRPELETEYAAPRDDIERQLVDAWGELLGVERVGIQDDFFALGGHSLIAVRLFARIKKKYGIEFPLSVLFDAPTIATCADLLRAELGQGPGDDGSAARRQKPRYRFLVPMNEVEGSSKLPFFLVAGMFGNVLNLRHLAAHLGSDQPVYALQAKGLYGDDLPHTRFEEMAQDYIRELRSVQPEGPYLLGGFSGGGLTAFEMAGQLLAQGEEIAALVLLDSMPSVIPAPTRSDRLRIQLQRLAHQGPGYVAQWARNRIRWERERRERRSRPTRELTPAEFRSEQIEAAFREALIHYRMPVHSGKVILFRPPLDTRHPLGGGRIANRRRELIDHANHWKPYVSGGIDVRVVPGDHDSMVLEPSVRVLAARVRECLEDAQRAKAEQGKPR